MTSSRRLTPSLNRTLVLLVHGASVRESAKAMGVKERTVSTYRYRLKCRLDLWQTADLIRWAVQRGIAELAR